MRITTMSWVRFVKPAISWVKIANWRLRRVIIWLFAPPARMVSRWPLTITPVPVPQKCWWTVNSRIWCVSVNDAFVMGAWARDQKSGGKVRMLADGSADFAKATGLTLDLTSRGMGLRSNRYSMLVKDGKVASLNVEAPGKFEVSNAETLLAQAKG